MIKLQVIGNLGRDCQVKEVNGKNVINFNVAHTERYKDNQGNQKERTTWAECAYWTDKTAISPYLTKGQLVYVEGSPEAEAYMNKENQAAATLRVRVSNIQLLGGKSNNDNQGQSTANNTAAYSAAPPPVSAPVSNGNTGADDLPF